MTTEETYLNEEYFKSKPLESRGMTKEMVKMFKLVEVKHPGEKIAFLIWQKRLKQKKVATLIGIANTAFNELIHGKRNITPVVAIKLEKLSGRAEYWLGLQNKYDLHQLRNK
jgi:addiction module HigA family antidote